MRLILGATAVACCVLAACTAAQPSPRPSASTPPTSTAATRTSRASSPSTSSSTPSQSTSPTRHRPPPKKVHIKLLNADGSEYGVGMPIIAFFSRRITNAAPLQQATTATVNGKKIAGAWYFERTNYYGAAYPIEGHFRPRSFWPAHSHVFVKIAAKGVSAGHDMVYDDSLTSSWTTGARNIGVVNDVTHRLTIRSDGHFYGRFPVSLGAASTPTFRGIKVIMEQLPTVCMTNTAHTYNECGIKWDSRLTYSGEYLHAAPWNCVGHPGCTGPGNNIGHADSSNGCTNLLPQDADRLYHFLRIGDVIEYPNADGPPMTLGRGYGDWNLSWSQWQTGGLVSTNT